VQEPRRSSADAQGSLNNWLLGLANDVDGENPEWSWFTVIEVMPFNARLGFLEGGEEAVTIGFDGFGEVVAGKR
jgi:hypothetical protein